MSTALPIEPPSPPTHPDPPTARRAPAPSDPVAVHARGLAVSGPRGPVFGPLDLSLPAGRLALLVGEHGTGRTCALLTMTGRMKPSAGELEVLGHRLPKQKLRVQRASALACSEGLDDIDDSLTVRELFAERLQMLFPAHRRGRLDQTRIGDLCSPTFDAAAAPSPKTLVWELSQPDRMALQIALALVGSPDLLAVDDIDRLPVPDRVDLFRTLQGISDSGTTVLAATSPDVLPAETGANEPPIMVGLRPGQTPPATQPLGNEPHPRHAAEGAPIEESKDA